MGSYTSQQNPQQQQGHSSRTQPRSLAGERPVLAACGRCRINGGTLLPVSRVRDPPPPQRQTGAAERKIWGVLGVLQVPELQEHRAVGLQRPIVDQGCGLGAALRRRNWGGREVAPCPCVCGGGFHAQLCGGGQRHSHPLVSSRFPCCGGRRHRRQDPRLWVWLRARERRCQAIPAHAVPRWRGEGTH
jgi:hypothetical protein